MEVLMEIIEEMLATDVDAFVSTKGREPTTQEMLWMINNISEELEDQEIDIANDYV